MEVIRKETAFSFVMDLKSLNVSNAIKEIAMEMQIDTIRRVEEKKNKELKRRVSEVSKNVSLFKSARNKTPIEELTINEFLVGIKEGRWREEITNYRNIWVDNKDEAKKEKPNLPAISYTGTFSRCEDASMLTKSNYLVIDIDNKRNTLDITSIKSKLKKNPFVYSFFESPSLGVKFVIKADFPAHETEFPKYYEGVCEFMSVHTGIPLAARVKPEGGKPYWTDGIDPINKNLSRLCFVSYDLHTFINKDAKCLPANLEEAEQEPSYPPIFWKEILIKGSYRLDISRSQYLKFLRDHGFCVRHTSGEDYQYLQIIDNIIYERTTKEVRSFVLDYVSKYPVELLHEMEDKHGESLFNAKHEIDNEALAELILTRNLFSKDLLHFLSEGRVDYQA